MPLPVGVLRIGAAVLHPVVPLRHQIGRREPVRVRRAVLFQPFDGRAVLVVGRDRQEGACAAQTGVAMRGHEVGVHGRVLGEPGTRVDDERVRFDGGAHGEREAVLGGPRHRLPFRHRPVPGRGARGHDTGDHRGAQRVGLVPQEAAGALDEGGVAVLGQRPLQVVRVVRGQVGRSLHAGRDLGWGQMAAATARVDPRPPRVRQVCELFFHED